MGGIILLGVVEKEDHTLAVTGEEDVHKMKADFWNVINNKQKKSLNILTERMVSSKTIEGKNILCVEVPKAETLETNSVRQQLFDNLQPNLQLDTDVKVQDMEDRRKRLIISMDVYVLSTNELLQRYLSCNLSCNHLATMSRQAFAKSILKPAIDDGYVQMLYPDKPNHRGQKYKLTEKGLMILRKLI